jgi:hypothetical protein
MDKRLPPELVRPLRFYEARPKEGHLLLKAFLRIKDASIRASLIDLIETLARSEETRD